MKPGAEGGDRLDAGEAGQFLSQPGEVPTRHPPGFEVRTFDHVSTGAVGQQLALQDIAEAVAAFGLVHIVGRDQHRDAFFRQDVNLIPKGAPGLGVDAGGRLIQQQKFRLVHDARR